MSQTVRQMIIDVLLEKPATAKDISPRVSIPEKEVFPHSSRSSPPSAPQITAQTAMTRISIKKWR